MCTERNKSSVCAQAVESVKRLKVDRPADQRRAAKLFRFPHAQPDGARVCRNFPLTSNGNADLIPFLISIELGMAATNK